MLGAGAVPSRWRPLGLHHRPGGCGAGWNAVLRRLRKALCAPHTSLTGIVVARAAGCWWGGVADLGHDEVGSSACITPRLHRMPHQMPQEFVVDGGVTKKMVYPEEEPAGAAGAAADAGAAGAQAAAAGEQAAAVAEQAAAGAEAVEEEEERPPIQWPETI